MISICVNHLTEEIRGNVLEIDMLKVIFNHRCILLIEMFMIEYKEN